MKLIKQSDGAGGLIFHQNTSGKAMKQNYNFGKAWKSYNPIGAYIRINKPILQGADFALLFFIKIQGSSTYNVISSSLGVNTLGVKRINGGHAYAYNNTVTGGQGLTQNIGMISLESGVAYYLNENNIKTSFATSPLTTNINYFDLTAGGTSAAYTKLNGLAIYDRSLSQTEINHRLNFKLGNELLNVYALWALYELRGAKILNTGGSDFIGIEDTSGNGRHEPILNLPVGSIKDQLAYANANLFEIW